jgi:5-methylcytosine-specific restriction endonuclease McrA
VSTTDANVKRCGGCSRGLPRQAFAKNRTKPDGLATQCRQCTAEYLSRYRSEKLELVRAGQRRHYVRNRIAVRRAQRCYRLENVETLRGKKRAYNRVYYRTEVGRSSKRNAVHRRRARKLGNGSTFTLADWHALIARSPHCHWRKTPFAATRRPTHDHVIPLSEDGEDTLENSVCACMECNLRKGARAIDPVTGQALLL